MRVPGESGMLKEESDTRFPPPQFRIQRSAWGLGKCGAVAHGSLVASYPQ